MYLRKKLKISPISAWCWHYFVWKKLCAIKTICEQFALSIKERINAITGGRYFHQNLCWINNLLSGRTQFAFLEKKISFIQKIVEWTKQKLHETHFRFRFLFTFRATLVVYILACYFLNAIFGLSYVCFYFTGNFLFFVKYEPIWGRSSWNAQKWPISTIFCHVQQIKKLICFSNNSW